MSSGGVDVRRARIEEWAQVRAVRLRALADAPMAFGSTLERERGFDEAEWRRRIGTGAWFLARGDDDVVGLVGARAEQEFSADRSLFGMWVASEVRGTAAAAELVRAACRWAVDDGAATVSLWVADGNPRARRFYEREGFAGTGDRQCLASHPDIGEELMRLRLPTGR